MEMLCLQKISYMNYITYIIKKRALSVEDVRVEKYDIFKNLVAEIFFLAHSRQFMFVKLQLFCDLLSSRKFPIF